MCVFIIIFIYLLYQVVRLSTSHRLDADYLDYSMTARTKFKEGTECADNKVAKLEGAQGHDEGMT